jgi:ferrous iron transport protein B
MTEMMPLVALVGNPNAGKSALFNALTGARQKIANYPGVTVERKSGRMTLADGRPVELVDLPGTYSLIPDSLDEQVTRNVVLGMQEGQRRPDALVVVVDAANLDNHLRFALELIALKLPIIIALNMVDLAERDGLTIDADILSAELGVPVVPTVAVRKRGLDALSAALDSALRTKSNVTPDELAARNSMGAPGGGWRNAYPPMDTDFRFGSAASGCRAGHIVRPFVRDVSRRICLVRSTDRLD